MLHGINPVLTGELLRALDRLGHGDLLLIADANYPAYSAGAAVIEMPLSASEALVAIRTVVPVDTYDDASVALMEPEPGADLAVQQELRAAIATEDDRIRLVERHEFYRLCAGARLVVRTAESRPYGNLAFRKGVVRPSTVVSPA